MSSGLTLAVVEGVAVPDTVVLVLAVVPLVLLEPRGGNGVGVGERAEVPERGTALPLFALAFLFCFSEDSSSGLTAWRFLEPLRCCAAKQTSQ